MKNIFFIALSILLITACTSTETKLEEAIENYYQNMNLQPGAGSHNITDIEILSFENDTAIAVITGYYKNNSLAHPEGGDIKNTLGFIMKKTDGELRVKKIFEVK